MLKSSVVILARIGLNTYSVHYIGDIFAVIVDLFHILS